ncbi:hypothetical protein [Algibacter agarivorans]|uniref:hypothetical protein n=1 Tax=Algibacter agarivorans TaxID=1109741 RepID=UPI0031EC1C9E
MEKFKLLFINYHEVIFGFLLLSLGFDFITKTVNFYGFEIVKFSKFLKAIFLVYSLLFIIINFKYVYNKLRVPIVIIIVLSVVFLLKNNFSENYMLEYIRYIFPLLAFPLMYFAYKNKGEKLLVKLYTLFKWLIFINFLLVFFGLLFEIKIFDTYYAQRFGVNGFLLSQGFAPFFYLSATILFWEFNDKKMLLLVFILCILSGVKGVYFGEFLLLSMLVFWSKKLSRGFKHVIIVILSLVFFCLLLFLYSKPIFREVYDSDGILSAIFSYRNDYTVSLYKQITPDNYSLLIGATNLQKLRLELQIIDVILFFGLIGLICYTVFLSWLYRSLVKTDVSKAFFISVVVLSTLSGNLLYIPLSLMLMFLVLIALKKQGN